MDGEGRTLLQHIWDRLTDREFSIDAIVQCIRKDGGMDMRHVSDEELSSIYRGDHLLARSSAVAFAFSEIVAYYGCLSNTQDMTDVQVVGWTFSILCLVESIDSGSAGLLPNFENILESARSSNNRLLLEERVYLMQRALRGSRYQAEELLIKI